MSINLSLDRIRELLTHFPPYTRPTCHIAGTNGKGSVSALLSSILLSSSPPYRVGRYNSPHLVAVNDCITIGNEAVSQTTYADARIRVENMNRTHNIGASSFELLTSVAFLIFEEAQVDIAVVEVGMGGRLDATNIIADEYIIASALTAVDLDHQAFLGCTVSDITREKVAIAREGKPFILGPQKHTEVETVAQEIIAQHKGDIIHAVIPKKREWDPHVDGPPQTITTLFPSSFIHPPSQPLEISVPCFSNPLRANLPLQGEHQCSNLGIALSVISALLTHHSCAQWANKLKFHERITVSSVSRGIRNATWPGRLSFHRFSITIPSATSHSDSREQDVIILADGAHNSASATTLSRYISDFVGDILSAGPRTSATSAPSHSPRHIALTYVLSLSHSPPKTPFETLSPLLPPPNVTSNSDVALKIGVALTRFTPPEGMPWVKSIPPAELKDVVASLAPNAQIYCPLDGESTDRPNQLEQALKWAGEQQISGDGQIGEGLIVVAGSLYLVADFYRLLMQRRVM